MGDFFKIVACIRKKRIEISYVPHQWESGGILRWPKSNLSNLRKDPSSTPQEDWFTFKAKVKKTNLMDLDAAQLWEENFVDAGTDAENSIVCETKINTNTSKGFLESIKNVAKKKTEKGFFESEFDKIDRPEINHDSIVCGPKISTNGSKAFFESNMNGAKKKTGKGFFESELGEIDRTKIDRDRDFSQLHHQPLQVTDQEKNLDQNDIDIIESINLEVNPFLLPTNVDENIEQQNYQNILEMLMTVQNSQQTILKNQEMITKKLETFEEKLKEYSVVNKATVQQIYRILQKEEKEIKKKEEDSIVKFDFPIKVVEDVFKLNEDLKDLNFFKLMIKNYESIGGSGGEEERRVIARKLRNLIFSEKVLTEFSWTGISRTTGISKKHSFQKCENIIDFFLQLIRQADNRWSATKNEKFFKFTTLKHAKQMQKASIKKTEKTKKQIVETELDSNQEVEEAEEMPHESEESQDAAVVDVNHDIFAEYDNLIDI